MAKKPVRNKREQAVRAALELAAEKGWRDVSLSDIAHRAKISLAEMHDYFEDRFDILASYGRMVDRQVLESAAANLTDKNLSPRDRLFDILMEHYDVLNENRAGFISIVRSFRTDPKQAVISLPYLGRSMNWMLEAAGIETAGMKGAIRVTALMAIYLKILWAWCEDESPDLSKTMAALDKNLERAERWSDSFGF